MLRASLGWKRQQLSTRAKWRSSSSARSSALENYLTEPRLSERRFIANRQSVLTGIIRRSEEHTSELQSPCNLVCRLLLEKKKKYPRARGHCFDIRVELAPMLMPLASCGACCTVVEPLRHVVHPSAQVKSMEAALQLRDEH